MAEPGAGAGDAAGAAAAAAAAADPAAAAAAAAGAGDPAGAATGSFMDGMDETVRAAISPRNYANVNELGKGFMELDKLVGAKGVIPPGTDATPEDWEKFYANPVLGRPDKSDGYELKAADGVKVDENLEGWFRGAAHKHGISQRQALGLFDDWNMMTLEANAAKDGKIATQMEEATSALLEKWGGQAKFDEKMALGNLAIAQYGSDELVTVLAESGFGRNPLMVAMFAEIGETLHGDGRLVGARDGAVPGIGGKVEAEAEIAKLRSAAANDANHPLNNTRHPEHQAINERMQALYNVAHPGAVTE